ncbi:hypothetical protein CBR_g36660 [Chara braunii]|uniref:Magnesium transporter protein 1 n=1 Tax=Chara braunii TaxID=69332 RepID=A0A388LLF3_CHABU|nr:hypothetical protein CBR_g36660 [Chara braunii]|eukprot:GBG83042.1 hypothetical protein CBR_g36660 [Chara braunii]
MECRGVWKVFSRREVVLAAALQVLLCFGGVLSVGGFSAPQDPRTEELLELQRRTTDGVIRLDADRFKRLAQGSEPRAYSLIIFFDADQLRSNQDLKLEELRREFGYVATAFIRTHKDDLAVRRRLFFADVEFGQTAAAFQAFNVMALPHIRHVPPSSGMTKPAEREDMDPAAHARTAEGIAGFVTSRTGLPMGVIVRPPPVTKFQILLTAVVFIVASPFVGRPLWQTRHLLLDPRVWCVGAFLIYFFSVSGGMYNIIRGMPMLMLDRNQDRNQPRKFVFFYKGSGVQLGAEGFIVGSLYTGVGALVALMTHVLPKCQSTRVVRLCCYVALIGAFYMVRKVVELDNWKTGYRIRTYWP